MMLSPIFGPLGICQQQVMLGDDDSTRFMGGGRLEVNERWRWPPVLFFDLQDEGWHSKLVKKESLRERETREKRRISTQQAFTNSQI